MERFGRWLADTRIGRFIVRLGAIVLVLGLIYLAISEEVHRQTKSIVKRVDVIEKVTPEDVVKECLTKPRCRHLIADAPRLPQRRGGDASQPAKHAGQQPAPAPAGGRHKKGKRNGPGTSQPTPESAPQAPPPHAQAAEPAPTPGNSGEADAGAKGVQACVGVVVSACVKTELP